MSTKRTESDIIAEAIVSYICESSPPPEGTVFHAHEIDHPSDRGRKAIMVTAYHKDAIGPSYSETMVARHATERPEGYEPHHAIGFAIFHKDKRGKTHRAYRLHTDSDWLRKGVATGMYDYARSKGLSIKPSSDQSGNGKLFWKGYRRHLKTVG